MAEQAEKFEYPRWLDELWANEIRLEKLAAELGDAGFVWTPAKGGWSAAQCVEHLVLTVRQFLPLWDAALASAEPGWKPVEYSWLDRQALHFMEPPYRMKSKTGKAFTPETARTRQECLEMFRAAHELMKERAERMKDLDVSRVQVPSPFLNWIHYNVAYSFDLALAHERRHLWQAEQNVPQVNLARDLAAQQS
jgi:hypothetical protein